MYEITRINVSNENVMITNTYNFFELFYFFIDKYGLRSIKNMYKLKCKCTKNTF